MSMLGVKALAKSSEESFDLGVKQYMAANCAGAMDPLYQASLTESASKDRATLYLAHCQSIYGRGADAGYNLDRIKSKNLTKEDRKLYKELTAKHQKDIDALNKLYFSATPYFGQGTTSPSTVKDASSFYGLSLGVSRPSWSVGAFYEGYTQKFKSAAAKSYTQAMTGGQLGYFVLPNWRVSGSYTSIEGSIDQLKSIGVVGAQTDFYITPAVSLFLEYYSSTYPKLLADSAGTYKYAGSASQVVAGLGFPIYNTTGYGFNGAVSYTGISPTQAKDAAVVANQNLKDDTARYEAVLSTYFAQANASLTYWSGKEVLGVRSRGAVVYNTTDLRKGGSKVNLGYTFTKNVGVGASYGTETYSSTDVDGKYRDFQSSTMTGMFLLNW